MSVAGGKIMDMPTKLFAHAAPYQKGCPCKECAAYRDKAREYGRKGAERQLALILQGKYGRCERCDGPIAGAVGLCAFCRLPLMPVRIPDCAICGKPFTVHGQWMHVTTCSPPCYRKQNHAKMRHRDHMRRAGVSDITPEQELAMRARARKCPLCDVRMTDKPHLPNSKELDHILPVNQGGTHTHGNVRIICRRCNQRRPKDGSDYTGMLTLWAQGPAPVSRPDRRRPIALGTCRKGLHPWIPSNIKVRGDGRTVCAECYAAKELRRADRQPRKPCGCGALFAARGNQFMCPACIDAAAHKAAELHAQGSLTWKQIAEQVGYGSANGEGARYAAKRIGYIPGPAVRTQPQPQRLCPGCGQQPLARYARRCDACSAAKAWQAVEMRFEQGRTLRYIADQLGYDSISSVTNLMKTVLTLESQMGRPC